MATLKIEIDNSKLLERMRRYEEVTGKQIGDTMRRGARLLAVNLATSTPPYGKNAAARNLGEKAVQNDILRVYTPATPIQTRYQTKQWSFQEQIEKFITKSPRLKEAILAAVRAADGERLKTIVGNLPTFSKLSFDAGVDRDVIARTRNAYGRVRKGWKGRNIVMNAVDLATFIQRKQDLVGLSKAAWAACAIDVKANVSDALSGIPAWVKRHVGNVPHAVADNSDADRPKITLTSKLPWAGKALRPADHKEAIRISREKFYKSMGIEIRAALKKAREESS
jgi:hypothetical protein